MNTKLNQFLALQTELINQAYVNYTLSKFDAVDRIDRSLYPDLTDADINSIGVNALCSVLYYAKDNVIEQEQTAENKFYNYLFDRWYLYTAMPHIKDRDRVLVKFNLPKLAKSCWANTLDIDYSTVEHDAQHYAIGTLESIIDEWEEYPHLLK